MESFKRDLTDDEKERSSVDWLTEVIRRYSDVALNAGSMSAVDMKSVTRQEMVLVLSSYPMPT